MLRMKRSFEYIEKEVDDTLAQFRILERPNRDDKIKKLMNDEEKMEYFE
jgi:hypothetical protein